MTRLGVFGLPESGGLIIVRPGAEPLRFSGAAVGPAFFDVRRDQASDTEPKLRKMLRTLIAIRSDGGKKK